MKFSLRNSFIQACFFLVSGTLSIMLLSTNSNAQCWNTVSFTLASNPVITSPYICAVADYNNDGIPDLAISNFTSGHITIFLGNGNGTFSTGTSFPVSANDQRGVVTADFNSDGNADLAVANQGSSNVSVLFGNGNGTFGASVQYATGTGPYSLNLGDFNGDGKADLAVPNTGTNTVTILLNNGSGVFSTSATATVGASPNGATVADFNGDSKMDIATCNQGPNNVSILLGNGNGTFQAATTAATGLSQPWQIANADFDKDNKIDLVVNNRSANSVTILKGDGAGGFTPFSSSPFTASMNNPLGVVTGDFNNDGNADVAVSNYGAANAVVMLGDGAGGFTVATTPGIGTNPWSLTAADFNGDGKLDLIGMNNNNTTVLLNTTVTASVSAAPRVCTGDTLNLVGGPATGVTYQWSGPNGFTSTVQSPTLLNATSAMSGTYTLTVTASGPCYATASVTLVVNTTPAPFNQTITACGSFDVGKITHTTSGTFVDHLTSAKGCDSMVTTVLTINPLGKFTQKLSLCVGQSVTVANHTYTSTGHYLDRIVGASANGCDSIIITDVSFYYGNGAASLSPFTNYPTGNEVYGITHGDFNGDGNMDIAAANYASGTVTILDGNGTGTFTTGTVLTTPNPSSLATEDFDGDGNTDLAVGNTNPTNTVSIFLGNGSGGFGTALPTATAVGVSSIIPVDFDGDGIIDLATGNGNSGTTVSVMLGNGNGTFQARTDYTMGTSSYAAAVADFNNDGYLDIAVPNLYSNTVTIIKGDGKGGFNPVPITLATSPFPRFIAVEDYNGDGNMDIAVAYQNLNNIEVFLSNGTGGFAAGTIYNVGNLTISLVTVDLNGDGILDLVSGDYSSNTLSVLLGIGNGLFNPAVSVPASINPVVLTTADFNNDGKPDIAAGNYGSPNVSVWLNLVSLTIQTTVSATTPVCTGGKNSTLTLTGPAGMLSYSWSGPNGFTSTAQSPTITNPPKAAAGIYTLTVTESHNCTATASTAFVIVDSAKTFSQTLPPACDSIRIGTKTYTISGTYTDTLTAASGCDSLLISTIVILTPGADSATASLPVICSGQNTTLTVTGSGSYSWSPAAGLNSGTTGSSVVANPTVSTTYTVTGTGGGCPFTDTVVITVGNSTIPGVISIPRDTICEGSLGVLTLTGNSSSTLQWQSSPAATGYTDISGATNATYSTNPLLQTTWFRVRVGSGTCLAYTDSIRVFVPPALLGNFGFTKSGTTVTFTDSSMGNINSYSWQFGDGGSSNAQNPVHQFANMDSIYSVCLTIYDGSNCSFTFCRDVAIVTGIEEINQTAWNIYPNPVNSELIIEGSYTGNQMQGIEIYDVLGRIVINKDLVESPATTLKLNVSGLTPGIYVLKIITSQNDFIQKIIKQ